ncbi:MAG: sugar ABC transporter permease [Actinobacteria bacterium]|nr:sugar ABC transporter permease [Actinomycetota bacterium]
MVQFKAGAKIRNTSFRIVAAFLAPALISYLFFVVYPLFKVFRLSFYDWRGVKAGAEVFVGFGNFKSLMLDPIFWRALSNNLLLFVFVLLISIIFALFFSYFIATKIKFSGLYKAAWLFPNILGDIIVVTIWLFIYHPTMGMLNYILSKIGIHVGALPWLGRADTALIAVSIPMIWKYMGLYIILFTAAIQEIPSSFLEAARIDGASRWKEFLHVILPLLKPTIAVAIVFMMYNSFSVIFTYIKFLTEGGPYRSTEVLPTYIFQVGFELHKFGYGSAISVVTFLLVSVFAIFIIRTLMRSLIHGETGF